MSDDENDSFISETNNNNIHYIERIENSYKIYINHLSEIMSDILEKIIRINSIENNDVNKDQNKEIILFIQ